jgi:hypothetical protein
LATLDLELLQRARAVLKNKPVTETELRALTDEFDGLVRVLGAQLNASEARLTTLSEEPDSSLTLIAGELHRVEVLRPQLELASALLRDLDAAARKLRTSWLLGQADSTRGQHN